VLDQGKDVTKRESREEKLRAILFWAFLLVFVVLVYQNLSMRAENKMLIGAAPSMPLTNRWRGIKPGDQILEVVGTGAATPVPFASVASAGPKYWWLFDPTCAECIKAAKAIGPASSQTNAAPLIGVLTTADMSRARAFLEVNNVRADLLQFARMQVPSSFQMTPQFFEVDNCGTVMKIFLSADEFVKAFTGAAEQGGRPTN
jgi:hypothetical protein